jgi:hypothetical protein
VTKHIIVALSCILLSACFFSSEPTGASHYFIISFQTATLEPTADGKIALASAMREAGGATSVMIDGALNDSPANAENGVVIQQRVADLEQQFVKAGVPAAAVKPRLREVGDIEFANRKDSLIVQLQFGSPDQP